jgi:hypothetical protein
LTARPLFWESDRRSSPHGERSEPRMASTTVSELKKHLVANGFVVYRSAEGVVFLAERPRDNLIMDANVSVWLAPQLRVRLVARAQRSDFPSSSETAEALFDRAREVAKPALRDGYVEVGTEVTPQLDPMDAARVLDTWYQVAFEKPVASIEQLGETVAGAMRLEKVAPR